MPERLARRLGIGPRDRRRHDLRPRPVDDDVLVEQLAEAVAVRRRPVAVVVERADDERACALPPPEPGGEAVRDERVQRAGILREQVLGDVVPEELERADADAPQLLDLVTQCLELGLVVEADREPRRDRPRQLDVVSPGDRDELGEPRELARGIEVAPALAVVRVVLRRPDEGVQLVPGAEGDQVEPLPVRPRAAVEAFDDPAHRQRRLVADAHRPRRVAELPQRLLGVVGRPGQHRLTAAHLERVRLALAGLPPHLAQRHRQARPATRAHVAAAVMA